MKICIHRGTNEIGGTCIELISKAGSRILLDMGLPLDFEGKDTRKAMPEVRIDKTIKGVIVSHGHKDHWGLLEHLPKNIPVFIGKQAKEIINSSAVFVPNVSKLENTKDIKNKKTFAIDDFLITPYLVDHSGFDAYSFVIEADGKRVFYSGDFRAHGRKSKLFSSLISNPPTKIDTLLMEGSSLGRLNKNETFQTEEELENDFVEKFKSSKKMILAMASAQNIDRVVTLFRACKRTGRTLIIDPYTALILKATGNKSIPQSDWKEIRVYIPHFQRVKIKKDKLFDLILPMKSDRIYKEELVDSAKKYVMLFRESMIKDIDFMGLKEEIEILYSMWSGYLKDGNSERLLAWKEKNNISLEHFHTSGHADIPTLKQLAKALNPTTIIPIHTFEKSKFPELFKNVEIKEDNEPW